MDDYTKASERMTSRKDQASREATIRALADAIKTITIGVLGHLDPTTAIATHLAARLFQLGESVNAQQTEIAVAAIECNDRIVSSQERTASEEIACLCDQLAFLRELIKLPNLSSDQFSEVAALIREHKDAILQIDKRRYKLSKVVIQTNQAIVTGHKAATNRTLMKTAGGILMVAGGGALWWWSCGTSTPVSAKLIVAGAALV